VNRLGSTILLAVLLLAAKSASAQDFKQYVGKSTCEPGVQSEFSDFSLRLDKTQQFDLVSRHWDKAQVVFIVRAKAATRCGVISDTIQITGEKTFAGGKHFEFRCFDAQAPTDVVVGMILRKYGNVALATAVEAWRIDLKEQKFVKTNHKVVCSADGWDGEDTGSDMIDEAKKYAAHGKPGQFGSESK
jgi:hypothetical protein